MDNLLENLKNKNIHIVGASGTEGCAVLEFLAKNGIENITAHDFSVDNEELKNNFFKTHLWLKGSGQKNEEFKKFLKLPIKLKLKNEYLEGITEADIIFAPSSWRLYKPNFPILKGALKKGVEFSSITKLYFELAKGKIISVTGTKGKGTTSKLIYEIMASNQKKGKVCLAGNDRRAAQELDKISKMKKNDILVLETSNRQLMIDLGRSPDIGVITNISPDHIDEHGSFEKYIEVKKSLFKYMKKSLPAGRQGDMAVLNYDNKIAKKMGKELVQKGIDTYFFSREIEVGRGAFIENGRIYTKSKLGNQVSKLGKEHICDLSDIKIIGEHNVENVLAAVLAAYLAGAMPAEIKRVIKNFHGLPHRLELVGDYNGAKFYDDLASTNPESTIAAIRAIRNHESRVANQEPKLFLISGGDDKGMDYSGLAKEIIDKVDTLILLPGTGSEKLKLQITNYKLQIKSPPTADSPKADKLQKANFKQPNNLNIFECNNFSDALELIKAQTKTGDIVLISPASAHFQARYIDIIKKPIRNLIVENFR